jgi:hypothetical protein
VGDKLGDGCGCLETEGEPLGSEAGSILRLGSDDIVGDELGDTCGDIEKEGDPLGSEAGSRLGIVVGLVAGSIDEDGRSLGFTDGISLTVGCVVGSLFLLGTLLGSLEGTALVLLRNELGLLVTVAVRLVEGGELGI